MTPKQKYASAFKQLLEAKKEVIDSKDNPYSLEMPTHGSLSNESFISDEELNKIVEKVGNSASDNSNFARLWNIGTDVVIKAKALIK